MQKGRNEGLRSRTILIRQYDRYYSGDGRLIRHFYGQREIKGGVEFSRSVHRPHPPKTRTCAIQLQLVVKLTEPSQKTPSDKPAYGVKRWRCLKHDRKILFWRHSFRQPHFYQELERRVAERRTQGGGYHRNFKNRVTELEPATARYFPSHSHPSSFR